MTVTFTLGPFTELTDGVFRAIATPADVNIGLVVGTDGALVIDTGSSPGQGAEIRRIVEDLIDVPVVAAVVTHHHFDHCYGLAAFDDLPTYGHDTLADWLGGDHVTEEAAELGFAATELRPPNRPMSLAKVIDLGGGRRVEVVHFGRGHTDGDLVVIVGDANLIFAGDLLEQSGPPAMGDDCHLKEWPMAIDGILGLIDENTVIVPGHGEPFDRIFAFTQRAEISAVYGQVEHLIQQGVVAEDALGAGEWPFDEATIRAVIPIAYAQLAAEGKRPGTNLKLI